VSVLGAERLRVWPSTCWSYRVAIFAINLSCNDARDCKLCWRAKYDLLRFSESFLT
jgi:hypothetical protein